MLTRHHWNKCDKLTDGVQQVEKERPFIFLLDPNHFLRDILAGAANTADGQKYVVVQEVLRQHLRAHTAMVVGWLSGKNDQCSYSMSGPVSTWMGDCL